MHANPDLPKLLRALAGAPANANIRPILEAALTEIETWRALPNADTSPIHIETYDAQGKALGRYPIPTDVLRAAHRVNVWLENEGFAASICGVTLDRRKK